MVFKATGPHLEPNEKPQPSAEEIRKERKEVNKDATEPATAVAPVAKLDFDTEERPTPDPDKGKKVNTQA